MSEVNNMTLQQIKDSLPKYRYLTPGVDVWREGDEYFSKYEGDWVKAVHMSTKILCEIGTRVSYRAVRRPIPDEVLDNQAFWVLYNRLADLGAMEAGYSPKYYSSGRFAGQISFGFEIETGIRKFSEFSIWHEIQGALGGEQNIIKHLSAGDLYSKWLGEQLT